MLPGPKQLNRGASSGVTCRNTARWLRCFILGVVFLLAPSLAHADNLTTYSLALNGLLWGNEVSSNFQFEDDFRLSSMNMNVFGDTVRASAGDISQDWDALSFAGRGFRGMAVGFPTGKVETTLIGGNIVVTDLLGREESSPVYGLRITKPLNERLRLSASQLFTPGSTINQGKGISSVGLTYGRDERNRVMLEAARSQSGAGWQLSWANRGKRLDLRTSYRNVSPGFSVAGNPLLRTDRSGFYLDARYRVAKPVTLSAITRQYDDGYGGHNRQNSVALQIAPRKLPALTFFWQTGSSDRSAFQGFLGGASEYGRTGLRLSQNFGRTRLSLGFDQLRFHYPTRALGDNATNRTSIAISRPINRRTAIRLEHIIESNNGASGFDDRQNQLTQLNVNHRIGKSGFSIDLGLGQRHVQGLQGSGQEFASRIGFNIPVSSASSIGIAYRTNFRASGSLTGGAPSNLYLGYTQRFQVGGRPRRFNTPRDQRHLLGQIGGRVFEDINLNGKCDAGEPAVSDVSLAIKSTVKTTTDSGGRYALKELLAGPYKLRLMMKTLPIEFTSLAPVEVPVEVAPGKMLSLDFPVVRTGHVKGTVFRDENRNGVMDSGEAGIPNILVRVEGNDTISFSDESGHFTLFGLPPGRWKIMADEETLNNELTSTRPTPLEVDVTPNGVVENAALGLAPLEREVITTFQK